MSKIKITNANNQHKFICFKIDGLKDGIMVGLYPNNDGLSIAYQEDQVGVPFNADSELIDELNDNSFPGKDEIDNTVVGTIRMSKETYDWLTTSSEDDDIGYYPACCTELDNEAFDEFEKDVMNPEINEEKVEAAKQIFEGVNKIPVDISSCIEMYGKLHLLELMDEWGINGSNYDDFRSVIQEHCLDKGIENYRIIEKTWRDHKNSIKAATKSIKKHI